MRTSLRVKTGIESLVISRADAEVNKVVQIELSKSAGILFKQGTYYAYVPEEGSASPKHIASIKSEDICGYYNDHCSLYQEDDYQKFGALNVEEFNTKFADNEEFRIFITGMIVSRGKEKLEAMKAEIKSKLELASRKEDAVKNIVYYNKASARELLTVPKEVGFSIAVLSAAQHEDHFYIDIGKKGQHEVVAGTLIPVIIALCNAFLEEKKLPAITDRYDLDRILKTNPELFQEIKSFIDSKYSKDKLKDYGLDKQELEQKTLAVHSRDDKECPLNDKPRAAIFINNHYLYVDMGACRELPKNAVIRLPVSQAVEILKAKNPAQFAEHKRSVSSDELALLNFVDAKPQDVIRVMILGVKEKLASANGTITFTGKKDPIVRNSIVVDPSARTAFAGIGRAVQSKRVASGGVSGNPGF